MVGHTWKVLIPFLLAEIPPGSASGEIEKLIRMEGPKPDGTIFAKADEPTTIRAEPQLLDLVPVSA